MARRNQNTEVQEVEEVQETWTAEEMIDGDFSEDSQTEEAEEVEAPTPKSTAGKIFILVFKNQKASGILHKVYTSRNYAESAYSREVKKDSGPRLYDVLEVMEIVDVESEVIATDSLFSDSSNFL